jgi:pimeloyl-ACP methyl ester carboxylesterase
MKLEIISKYPTDTARPTPLLFVHGSLHGAWCWDVHFLDYFAAHGYAAHAVDLRGHGASEGREKLRWTRIADYVDDVSAAAHAAPAAVLLSSPSPAGLLPTALRIARRHPVAFARTTVTRSLLPIIASPELAREAFFSNDLPGYAVASYWRRMQDDSYRSFLDMVALDLPHPRKVKAPLLVLGVSRDNMLSAREIRATGRAYAAPSDIIADVAHNSMLELRWQAVADRILAWLQQGNW